MDAAATSETGYDIDIHRIMEMIPHRLVDVVPGVSAIGIKNVSINEPFFQGHFPKQPVMPGVLIVEAMAQTAAALVVESLGGEAKGKLVYFMSVDSARFRRKVVPGDQLQIQVTKMQQRKTVWKFYGEAKVDGRVCAEATYAAMIADYDGADGA